MEDSAIRFSGRPERVFISVDERTGRSTLSFAPTGVGAPLIREGDASGEAAMVTARAIVAKYDGCVIVGPHFHASRPPGSPTGRRRR
ncbi:MAG TPA: hypothetical protein VL463_34075 [Kofleriaceae bacterium]|jgi:hypothetical protein|nr:hypothetical protein [Kofleriaceae bacterium]